MYAPIAVARVPSTHTNMYSVIPKRPESKHVTALRRAILEDDLLVARELVDAGIILGCTSSRYRIYYEELCMKHSEGMTLVLYDLFMATPREIIGSYISEYHLDIFYDYPIEKRVALYKHAGFPHTRPSFSDTLALARSGIFFPGYQEVFTECIRLENELAVMTESRNKYARVVQDIQSRIMNMNTPEVEYVLL